MDRVEVSRTILKAISRLYMLPWFRVIGGPRSTRWGGSLCVLRTRGRRTGRIRQVPLDYAPAGDGIYVLAGLGDRTHWLSNLRADPHVEVQFGRRVLPGIAREVTTPAEWLVAVRSVLCHCGFVGYCYGFSPFRVSDARLARATRGVRAVRIELGSSAVNSPLVA